MKWSRIKAAFEKAVAIDRTAWTRWVNVERTISAAREGQRDFRGQCFLKSPPFSYSRNAHSLSFVGLGKFGANAQVRC